MPNRNVHCVENLQEWQEHFENGWLAAYQSTGEVDWHTYRPPINKSHISGKGVNLSTSRLMLISSAGAFLPASQQPFNASSALGDYSIRELPTSVDLKDLSFAHDHYDHQAVDEDPQVLVPLDHLRALQKDGAIGELIAPISFMGYQPDVFRVVTETFPAILEKTRSEKANAVLLVPS